MPILIRSQQKLQTSHLRLAKRLRKNKIKDNYYTITNNTKQKCKLHTTFSIHVYLITIYTDMLRKIWWLSQLVECGARVMRVGVHMTGDSSRVTCSTRRWLNSLRHLDLHFPGARTPALYRFIGLQISASDHTWDAFGISIK